MMFGYATNETANYMPLALDLAHSILRELSAIRKKVKRLLIFVRMLKAGDYRIFR